MAKPPNIPPTVIWKKRFIHEHVSPLVRAVRTDSGGVEFEYLDSRDAMGGERWLGIERMPGTDFEIEFVSAVRAAFIGNAAARLAEDPIIQEER